MDGTHSGLFNLWRRFPKVARLASAARTSQPWAEGWNPVGILKTEGRRRGIFVGTKPTKMNKLRRSGIGRPDGARNIRGVGSTKISLLTERQNNVSFELLEERVINLEHFFAAKPQLF